MGSLNMLASLYRKIMKSTLISMLAIVCFGMLMVYPSRGFCSDAIVLRGVVEGFYGTPWTHQQRLELFDFMEQKGMNAYIYAPKDEDYHRKLWRQAYPDEQRKQLKELVRRAKSRNVEFIYAISPGNDIDFSGANKESDRQAMEIKLQAMYKLGVRRFALLFDDIPVKDADGQAEFANWLNESFVNTHRGCKPLILVPTEYFRKDMESKGEPNEYTKKLSQALSQDILVLHTGEEVCPDGLKMETMEQVNKIYGRVTGLWWNYPVNDYIKRSVGLGPISDIDSKLGNREISAFFVNPMENAALSRIAIATAADFSVNPAGYNPEESWTRAVKEQYGDLADDMMVFARHSQRLQNNWAHIGRQDAPQLQAEYKRLWAAAYKYDKSAVREISDKLLQENHQRIKSIDNLEKKLPAATLGECASQLKLLRVMSEAEEIALGILNSEMTAAEAEAAYEKYADKLLEVEAAERSALVSQKALRQFTVDFVKWYQIRYGRS